jgi:glycosyltransferase involved in cell wall biosynthesis
MPVVSVILNSYNQGHYLAEAVESVLAQTLEDIELIVLDNGSTDDSPRLLKPYEGHPKVRLILHEENSSVTRRFNEGVALARGEFVSFLYSDDFYLPTKLERQVARFAELPSDYGVVYGPALGFNVTTGKTWTRGSIGVSGMILREMFRRYEQGPLDMITPLSRRSGLLKYPFFDDIFAEGESIYFRLAMSYRFSYLDEPLAVIRDHTMNAGKAVKRNTEIAFRSLERLEAHPDFPPELRGDLIRYKATVLRNHGWQTVRVGGDCAWARSCFADALRTDWRQALHPRLFAGLGLSFLPASLLGRLNGLGNAVRRLPNNSVHVEDFGGSIKEFSITTASHQAPEGTRAG